MATMPLDERDQLINNIVCGITGAEMARDGQIQAIRRLLYEKADTILVAPSAYGKRAVLYAFALLSGKIIIQIIPTESIAKDQARAISAEVTGSRPIVVTDGLLVTTDFYDKMRAGKYTHILVSPELAANPKFIGELARDPEFQKKLGLFAVHELHLISKWKEYYTNGVFLDGLRYALPGVPWYASTAALDLESQEIISMIAGVDLKHTKYIHASICDPQMSATLHPLDNHLNVDTAPLQAPQDSPSAHGDQSDAKALSADGETDSEESDDDSVASNSCYGSPNSTSAVFSPGDFEAAAADEPEEEKDEYQGKPASRTLAWFVLQNLSVHCQRKASERDDLPVDLTDDEFDDEGHHRFYMDLPLQFAISHAYSRGLVNGHEVPFSDEWSLLDQVPAIEDWEFWDSRHHVNDLIEFCRGAGSRVYEDWVASQNGSY
ncbi:hypothetical protein B0T21DRAFT_350557 [Apiosordaria backusii]|uniref:DEAD/DEAH box helicase domain-containing protein n=1 Tax=Apiosordaria backusii TaxID=314023 RepID=A0AA40E394_9PEZI|nr:hypothetical protein B0T21DRAFT_350557 [Apiosordaria backusii]